MSLHPENSCDRLIKNRNSAESSHSSYGVQRLQLSVEPMFVCIPHMLCDKVLCSHTGYSKPSQWLWDLDSTSRTEYDDIAYVYL